MNEAEDEDDWFDDTDDFSRFIERLVDRPSHMSILDGGEPEFILRKKEKSLELGLAPEIKVHLSDKSRWDKVKLIFTNPLSYLESAVNWTENTVVAIRKSSGDFCVVGNDHLYLMNQKEYLNPHKWDKEALEWRPCKAVKYERVEFIG